ncbi:MAG TPA: hypothetical protein VI731_08005, partial [Bacteroidia bacterium]|nr:hypothetical protein [Bacteroidia bacterium]
MKNITAALLVAAIFLVYSCGDGSVESRNDTITDTLSDTGQINDTTRIRFRKLVAALPVPFDILRKFSGAKLPFRKELLLKPEAVSLLPDAKAQAIHLGIFGADIAYLISQSKLSDAGPYLGSVRRLSDLIVIPTAFDAATMKRFEANKNRKDSMQHLVNASYKRIDSTLQGNDRLILATLVIYGGWIESLYITTKHIGDEPQNEKNKVLYDMLAIQQPYMENINGLLATFPDDSTCAQLSRETIALKKDFPTGNISPGDFSAKLAILRDRL